MKKILALSLAIVMILALAAGCASGGGAVKTGQGHIVKRATTTNKDTGLPSRVRTDSIFVTASFDASGKVISATIDNAQSDVNFTAEGTLDTEKTPDGAIKTKQDKKEEYGMKANGSQIGREWYEQANALADWMKGKTVAEITGLKTKEVDENHKRVPDVSDLLSSVTIDVGDYLDALKLAYDNAK